MTFGEFQNTVNTAGLTARECRSDHWQIRGGKLLVNYWPSSRQIHVDQTKRSFIGTVEQAIEAALKPPPIRTFRTGRDTRKKNTKYKRRKDRKWTAETVCYWCGKSLLREHATVDHKIPLARGGMDIHSNFVFSCQPCNVRRGSDMPELQTT